MNAPDTPAKPLNIFQRVQKVMEAVAYVQKDKKVENYLAVSHDAVTAFTRPHFVKYGIVMVPKVIAATMVDTGRKSTKGTPAMRYEARFDIAFVNVDEPTDRIVITLDAHADDYGDKAPGKCASYATKTAILKLLMLETGENDESRLGPPPREYTEEEQALIAKLRETAMNYGTESLRSAWQALTKEQRHALIDELESLRMAAVESDRLTAAKGKTNA